MSTLQVANIHFESTANNRLQYAANGVTLFTGGTQAFFANSTVLTGPGGNQIPAPPSATQGAVLYFNGTSWVSLPAGTSGQFLQTKGTGENPVWTEGGLRPTTIYAGNLGSSNNYVINVSTGNVSTMYEYLEVAGTFMHTNTTTGQAISLQLSGDNGSTYGTIYSVTESVSTSSKADFNFRIFNTANTTASKLIYGYAATSKNLTALNVDKSLHNYAFNGGASSNTLTNIRFVVSLPNFEPANTQITIIGWK